MRALRGIVRGESEAPNRYVLLPEGQEALDYGPVCSGAAQFELLYTHLPAVWLHPSERLSALERMQMLTGVMHDEIPLGDPSDLERLIYRVPDMKYSWGNELLYRLRPKTMEELIQTLACTQSGGGWPLHVETLLKSGKSIAECLCTKEDVLRTASEFGLDREDAKKLARLAAFGLAGKKVAAELLSRPSLPDWFRESCRDIRHLTSRAHAVTSALTMLRFAYYEDEFPWEYENC